MLDRLEKDLDGLEPPEEVEEQNDELANALGRVSASCKDLVSKIEAGEPRAVRQATVVLLRNANEVRKVRRPLAAEAAEL